ncbi:MAG TPA: HmuY family protein [Aquaticitalea sp.]|nr:HmuY family protein [Aquaticitalea sp.]HNU59372.1 HmuY family protein [Aquaticitalea sp.]
MTNKFFSFLFCALALTLTNCSSDDDGPTGPIQIIVEGASIAPEVGGPNQPNQVYIDLSTNTSTTIQRDSWDLAFYSGSNFRVGINGSIYMAAAQLSATDINAVNSSTPEVVSLKPQVAVGTFQSESANYIDAPDGSITGTAIAEISSTDANNHVYLLNLGFEVGTEPAATGGVNTNGPARGWKKIKVLRSGSDYVLQYADLDATTFEEVTVSKNPDYNFTFFSFNTESIVSVEPQKANWDLNFTVFTNIIEGYGAYGYADFVANNTKGNALVYMVDSEVETTLTYDNFTLADVVDANFTTDQRNIGASWRNGGGPGSLPTLKDNMFYIVNDTDGNLYKLKFLALTNQAGDRGYPEFVYSLLQ